MITEGQIVKWTHATAGKNTVEFKVKKGIVVEIDGDTAVVVYGKNRRRVKIALANLKTDDHENRP